MKEQIRISKSIWNQYSWEQILFLTRFAYSISDLTAWQRKEHFKHPYMHLFPREQVTVSLLFWLCLRFPTHSLLHTKNSVYTFLAELKRLPQERADMRANKIQSKETSCCKGQPLPLCQATGKIGSKLFLMLYWNVLVSPHRRTTLWFVQRSANSQLCIQDFG